jgi:hypothetical protein
MQPDTMSLPANVAAIDRALDRLRQPTTVHDRLAILQELIEFWHGPIRPEDGMTDAEMTSQLLPLPLRRQALRDLERTKHSVCATRLSEQAPHAANHERPSLFLR